MNRSSKKGFTIVELVIVIAVIGILAAVLIPTFSGLIKKAQVASDETLVKNLNTALRADTDNQQHQTMTQALAAARNFGFDVDKINAKVGGNEILWDSLNDCFVYIDEGKVTYIPDSKVNGEAATYKLWKIYDKASEIPAINAQTYSIYLADNQATSIDVQLSVGFDAGENSKLTELTYTGNTESRDIVIRTNGANVSLNVNGYISADGNGDKIYHYGTCGKVVANVAMHCYYENGNTAYLELQKGKVVAQNAESSIKVLYINSSDDVAVEAKPNAIVGAYAVKNVANVSGADVEIKTADEIVSLGEQAVKYAKENEDLSQFQDKMLWIECKAESFADGEGTEANPYKIASSRQLALLAYNVNNGIGNYASAYYQLADNIDLKGKGWTPIGNLEHPFAGSISGKHNTNESYVISNMNDSGFDAKISETVETTYTQSSGNVYGLFGIVGTLEGQNVVAKQTFEYIGLSDVSVKSKTGIIVGGLVGADTASVKKDNKYLNSALSTDYKFDHIEVGGDMKLINTDSATIAGIVCKMYTSGSVELTYCTNNASLTAMQSEGFNGNNTAYHKGGGIAGYLKNNKSDILDNCTNNGTITINGYMFGGIYMMQLDAGHTGALKVTNCKNTATIYNYGYSAAMNDYGKEYENYYCGGATIGYNQLNGTITKTINDNANEGKIVWQFNCTWHYGNIECGGSWNETYANNVNDYNFRTNNHTANSFSAELK